MTLLLILYQNLVALLQEPPRHSPMNHLHMDSQSSESAPSKHEMLKASGDRAPGSLYLMKKLQATAEPRNGSLSATAPPGQGQACPVGLASI